MTFDLIIKDGTIIDPSQNLIEKKDIGISDGKIASVSDYISESDGVQIITARGKYITAGLIDLHVHVWWGVAHLAIPADPVCIERGVTTAIDAGSSGANTFPGFHHYVIEQTHTRILAFLHISGMGQLDNDIGELEDIRWARVDRAVEMSDLYKDVIVGIKVRLSGDIVGKNDLFAFSKALEAGIELNKPLMIHVGGSINPIDKFLEQLRPGDIVTHAFTGRPNGIVDNNGRVIDAAKDAIKRGVIFDVGHGAGSFSFDIAEKCLEEGILPGTISSDVHKYNVNGPVYDLLTTLSKFLYLGLGIEEVVKLSTVNPSSAIGMDQKIGTLNVGADADVAIIDPIEKKITLTDSEGEIRVGKTLLVPVTTLKNGNIFVASPHML
jgi:dihydroorotase